MASDSTAAAGGGSAAAATCYCWRCVAAAAAASTVITAGDFLFAIGAITGAVTCAAAILSAAGTPGVFLCSC